MITVSCCHCQHQIEIEPTPEIGQAIKCVNCKNVFEITWLFPISLDCQESTGDIPANQTQIPDSGIEGKGE